MFGFAGLWEHWARGDEAIESYTIIVTDANELARTVRDRMPVIIAPENYDGWLASAETTIPLALLQCYRRS